MWRFGGSCSLQLQEVKVEAGGSFRTLEPVFPTWLHGVTSQKALIVIVFLVFLRLCVAECFCRSSECGSLIALRLMTQMFCYLASIRWHTLWSGVRRNSISTWAGGPASKMDDPACRNSFRYGIVLSACAWLSHFLIFFSYFRSVEPGHRIRYSDWLRTGCSGVRFTAWKSYFSQTVHPVACPVGTVVLSQW